MNDMFENLGQMLNKALEEEKLPEIQDFSSDENENSEEKSNFIEKNAFQKPEKKLSLKDLLKIKRNKNPENEKNVLKMHKYTDLQNLPLEIQNALTTLDIVYPVTKQKVNSAYRRKIKQLHPDKKSQNNHKITIQTSKNVYKTIQLTIDDINSARFVLLNCLNVNKF